VLSTLARTYHAAEGAMRAETLAKALGGRRSFAADSRRWRTPGSVLTSAATVTPLSGVPAPSNGAPHSSQNFAPEMFSLLHTRHIIVMLALDVPFRRRIPDRPAAVSTLAVPPDYPASLLARARDLGKRRQGADHDAAALERQPVPNLPLA
jgi:hypothetical protein